MWESLFIPGIQHRRRQNTSLSVFDDIYLTDELIAGSQFLIPKSF